MRVVNNLNDFAIVQSQTVAWGEMDAFAHVNNIVYYRYFESVRTAILNLTFHPVFGLAGGIGSKLCSMNAISASQLSKHR
jgi:acyl-CoA thioesterase FadM